MGLETGAALNYRVVAATSKRQVLTKIVLVYPIRKIIIFQ
jgi:hypothetical protein